MSRSTVGLSRRTVLVRVQIKRLGGEGKDTVIQRRELFNCGTVAVGCVVVVLRKVWPLVREFSKRKS